MFKHYRRHLVSGRLARCLDTMVSREPGGPNDNKSHLRRVLFFNIFCGYVFLQIT